MYYCMFPISVPLTFRLALIVNVLSVLNIAMI